MKKDTVIVFPLRVFLGGGRRGGAPSVECGERSLETMAQQETSPDLEAKPPRLPGPPPREWEGEGESRVQEQKEEEREGAEDKAEQRGGNWPAPGGGAAARPAGGSAGLPPQQQEPPGPVRPAQPLGEGMGRCWFS